MKASRGVHEDTEFLWAFETRAKVAFPSRMRD